MAASANRRVWRSALSMSGPKWCLYVWEKPANEKAHACTRRSSRLGDETVGLLRPRKGGGVGSRRIVAQGTAVPSWHFKCLSQGRSRESQSPQARAVPAGQLASANIGWYRNLPRLLPHPGISIPPASPHNGETARSPEYGGIPRGIRCSHRWRRVALTNDTTASISRTVAMATERVTAAMICSKRISTSNSTLNGCGGGVQEKPNERVPPRMGDTSRLESKVYQKVPKGQSNRRSRANHRSG